MRELDPKPFVFLFSRRKLLRNEFGRTDIPLDTHYSNLYGFSPRVQYEQDRAKYPA